MVKFPAVTSFQEGGEKKKCPILLRHAMAFFVNLAGKWGNTWSEDREVLGPDAKCLSVSLMMRSSR
jgi:hypothetical protein